MTLKTLLRNMLRGKSMNNLKTISVTQFSLEVKDQDCLIIDVRSDAEFAEQHVKGATLFPLDRLCEEDVLNAAPENGSPIYILCKAGGRALKAAKRIAPKTSRSICVVEGGTDACIKAGM